MVLPYVSNPPFLKDEQQQKQELRNHAMSMEAQLHEVNQAACEKDNMVQVLLSLSSLCGYF
jgi:hypothetical protein